MKFSLEATDANQIHFYDDDHVIISPDKQSYSIQLGTRLIVTPDTIVTDSEIDHITDLSKQNIIYLQSLEPEVVIFTTGLSAHYPSATTAAELAKNSIGAEFMTLGSACRTYNLLVLEGRRAILVISPI